MGYLTMNGKSFKRGFTLVEILIVLAILSLLTTIVLPRYFQSITIAKENALKDNLIIVRRNIDIFYSDKGRYPESIEELVSKGYLKNIPTDPTTDSDQTWLIIYDQSGKGYGVKDIRSGNREVSSNGKAINEF